MNRFVTTILSIHKDNWLVHIAHRFIVGSIVLSFITWAVFYPQLPPLVPLWYSRPWGEEQLVAPLALLILPLGSIVWYSVGLMVVKKFTSEDLLYTQVILGSTMVTSVLSFIILSTILTLVL